MIVCLLRNIGFEITQPFNQQIFAIFNDLDFYNNGLKI
jgi:hypothetical protein